MSNDTEGRRPPLTGYPPKQGLYDPAFEHDSCGFGLIANIDGKASSWLVDQAFSALARMSHRGGVNADGITGDGCGVLIYRADVWLLALANEASIPLAERFAIRKEAPCRGLADHSDSGRARPIGPDEFPSAP